MKQAPLKILLVDDDEDEYVLTRDLLAEAADEGSYDLRWAGTWGSAVAECRRGRFGVYLIDYRLGGRNGLELLRDELDHGRKAPSIILTGQGTAEVSREARESGAAAFLAKGSVTGAELHRAMQAAIERHKAGVSGAERMDRRVLGILGAKGGVGTSTVALNVAMALIDKGRGVTLLELTNTLDSVASRLGLEASDDVTQLASLPTAEITDATLSARLTRHRSGVRLLSAPRDAAALQELDETQAGAIVRAASRDAGVVVVDLGAGPSKAARGAMALCDFVAVLVDCDPACLPAAEGAMVMLRTWRVPGTIGLVAVQRSPLARPLPPSQLIRRLGAPVYGVIPSAAEECSAELLEGAPVVATKPGISVAQAINDLAGRLYQPMSKPLNV